jgi:hypothetical protein
LTRIARINTDSEGNFNHRWTRSVNPIQTPIK